MAKKKGMTWYDYLAIVLLIIGGLNWGLVGFFDFNLVTFIFSNEMLQKLVYLLVFISAVYSSLWLGFGKK